MHSDLVQFSKEKNYEQTGTYARFYVSSWHGQF